MQPFPPLCMTLLHAVSGLTAGVNGQLRDSSASIQERPAASHDRRSGVPYRTEYHPTGLCRCLYSCHLHTTAGLGYFHACDLHCSAAASADLTGTWTGLAELMLRLMQGQLEMSLARRGAGRKERREGAHVLNLL